MSQSGVTIVFLDHSGSLCAAFLPPPRRAALHNGTIVVLSDNEIGILLGLCHFAVAHSEVYITANLSLKCGEKTHIR